MRSLKMTAALLALVMLIAAQCAAVEEKVLYDGKPAAEAGITIGPWGSGAVEESTDQIVANSKSIKIASQGLYSGARIDFSPSVTLYTDTPSNSEYLRLLISFSSMDSIPSVLEFGEPTVRPRVTKIRVVLYPDGEDVPLIEAVIPVGATDQDGWWPVAMPLLQFKAPIGEKMLKIKRMIICSDAVETMFLGEIRTITDTTPIVVEPLDMQVTQANYPVALVGVATGGISPLAYYWDFNKGDGIQEDAFGEQIVHMFRKPGEYTATLTVKDVFGVKKPATTTVSIEINE